MSTLNFGPERRPGQEPGGDLWRHTLARIPTLFGRVLFLSSLCNKTGEYEHPGLAQMIGAEEAAEILRRSHARAFQDWLCLNLEQQKADLQEYLAEIPNPAAMLADWTAPGACRNWAPSNAQDVERRLFAADLEILLAVLKREYGGVSPDPAS
ncbi:MAG: hypothetical protein ABSG65_16455 [Bryobacteraceae bacterium]|jgi:hypothetical protein